MRDFEFIHAAEDVPRVLRFASKLGLVIRDDRPHEAPEPKVLSTKDLAKLTSGSFMLYKPEWIFGPFKFDLIQSGFNKGKYFQNPATNYAAVSMYFSGERTDDSVSRLGSGSLSRNIDWYRSDDQTVHAAPADVRTVFQTIQKHIDTRKRLRGGVHNYGVLESAWKKLVEGSALPPFDYIEWPP